MNFINSSKFYIFLFILGCILLAFIMFYFFPHLLINYEVNCGNQTIIAKDINELMYYQDICFQDNNNYINNEHIDLNNGIK